MSSISIEMHIIAFCVYLMTVIFMVLAFNGVRKLYLIRNIMLVKKRSMRLIIGLNAPLSVYLIALFIQVFGRTHAESIYGIRVFGDLLSPICLYSFICICNVRSWLVYYKQKWTVQSLKHEWQKFINEEESKNGNWFLRNNYKYGSTRYIINAFSIIHGVAIIFSFGLGLISHLGHIDQQHAGTIAIAMTLPLYVFVIFFAVINCKTRKMPLADDIFFIHWENKKIARFVGLFLILQFLGATAAGISGDIDKMVVYFTPLYVVAIYLIIHTSTYSVYNKNRKHMRLEREPSVSATSSTSTTSPNHSNSSIKLAQVLSNELAVHLFMTYLSKEYSMECLLSVMELNSFQHQAMRYISDQEEDISVKVSNYMSQNVPIAPMTQEIVDDDVARMKTAAHRLYHKYIKADVEFEVNIGFEQREELKTILEDLDRLINNNGIKITDIILLFENVKEEMYKYLVHSLRRFKSLPEFDDVVNLFDNQSP